jgi:sialic acid synthase SpsE
MTKLLSKAKDNSVYFIAEIGQNHQGKLEVAKTMVESLRGLPISAIKTAKRDIDVCLTEEQKKMTYDNMHSFGKTYYEHRKALELSKEDFKELRDYVKDAGFDFISSFTDKPSLDFLCEINVDYLKIASQRAVDNKLLKYVAATQKPVIMSSGMCTSEDVDDMVDILGNNEKYLLQCTSVYPCPESLLNVNVLKAFMLDYFGEVDGFGFSGHHTGIAPDLLAYFMGADIIERHYTLNRGWKGTDHALSLGVEGIKYILKYIKQTNDARGSFYKEVLEEEKETILKLRADLKVDI